MIFMFVVGEITEFAICVTFLHTRLLDSGSMIHNLSIRLIGMIDLLERTMKKDMVELVQLIEYPLISFFDIQLHILIHLKD